MENYPLYNLAKNKNYLICFTASILFLTGIFLPNQAVADGGGLNSFGCHQSNIGYHCHRNPDDIVRSITGQNRILCRLGSDSQECRYSSTFSTAEVSALQSDLKLHCSGLSETFIDGIMGPETRQVIKEFNLSQNLGTSEIVSSQTRLALRETPNGRCNAPGIEAPAIPSYETLGSLNLTSNEATSWFLDMSATHGLVAGVSGVCGNVRPHRTNFVRAYNFVGKSITDMEQDGSAQFFFEMGARLANLASKLMGDSIFCEAMRDNFLETPYQGFELLENGQSNFGSMSLNIFNEQFLPSETELALALALYEVCPEVSVDYDVFYRLINGRFESNASQAIILDEIGTFLLDFHIISKNFGLTEICLEGPKIFTALSTRRDFRVFPGLLKVSQ